MMPSKTPFRSLLPLFFRRYHHHQRSYCANRENNGRRGWFPQRLGPWTCLGAHCNSSETLYRLSFSSRSSITPTSANNTATAATIFKPIPSRNDGRITTTPTATATATATHDKIEPVRWRFRDQGAIGKDEEIRVVFAGPHFHAALPSLQAEIDRRRAIQVSSHGSRNNNTSAGTMTKNHFNHHIRLVHAPTTEELWKEARTAHVAIPFMEAFPKQFFGPDTTPKLRLVVQFGVGLEGVDITEATARGVAVSNVPAIGSGNAQATAEHALYLAISLLRGFPTENYRSRFPNQSLGGLPIPRTLYRKRATVVGYGAVGSCLARYLSALGARVTVLRRTPWEKEGVEDDNAGDASIPPIHKARSLEEALPTTDVLFLACTLTPESASLLNHATIPLLPRGALVVNVARGALVDHGAMLSSLRSGHIGGFASDVGIGHPTKASEPWDPGDAICHLGPNANVMFTPHVGGYSDASYEVMVQTIADAIEHVIRGEAPPVWVNDPSVATSR